MVSRLLAFTAFLVASPAIGADSGLDAAAGKALFERNWVSAPSTNRTDAGLGPLYDARSCNACHAGAGAGAISDKIGAGLIVRLGHSDGTSDEIYGSQLQTRALPGLKPEANVRLDWTVRGDLRQPLLHVSELGYGALDSKIRAGVRRAPSLFGVAQLAAISEEEILTLSLREKASGMSGHPAWLTNSKGETQLGRWGWKAATADLSAQIALAMQRDIGISSTLHPKPWGECTVTELACRGSSKYDNHIEATDDVRALILEYLSSLPTPSSPDERADGFKVFHRIGCDGCHARLTNQKGERVRAYTDLLLHDLGPGLSDGITEGDAIAQEWRTAPLWTLPEELAAGGLMHDGRARSIAEAVRWHGGVAAPSRARFATLKSEERQAIEDFLLKK